LGEFQAYPKCKYHYSGKTIAVQNPEEEKALGGGWANNPTAFAFYQGPKRALPQHDPVKWVDDWTVAGISEDHRNKIRVQLLRAHAAHWKSPEAPNADTEAMRLAFGGVAQVLLDAGLLSREHLLKEIPQLVWDSAIAGGWWRLASETPRDMFPDKLGHYWIWRDDSRDWDMLFAAEAAKWRANLLEASGPVSDPTEPPEVPRRKRSKLAEATASTPVRVQSWDEIEIVFLSDERVQIWYGRQPETCNYDEMGFVDRRNGTPSQSWILLRALAQNQGQIPTTGRSARPSAAFEKRIERTRKLLQTFFGLSEDPLPLEKGVGYRLRCKIGCAPSFEK
jgi:hypothetical protein